MSRTESNAKRYWINSSTLWPGGNYNNALAYTPDGTQVLSEDQDGTISFWNALTGVRVNKCLFKDTNRLCFTAAISPNGKYLATSTSTGSHLGHVVLVDCGTGETERSFQGHSREINHLAFSPDSQLIASASDDKTLALWDTTAGDLLSRLEGHSDKVYVVAFSPDGKNIASGSVDGVIRFWDAFTGRPRGVINGHKKGVDAIAFSPDGNLVASGSDRGQIKFWDSFTGEARGSLKCYQDNYKHNCVLSIAFSPDGKLLASGTWGGPIRLWHLPTRKLLCTLNGHRWYVGAVAFSPDGKQLASASRDQSVRLWDQTTVPPPAEPITISKVFRKIVPGR